MEKQFNILVLNPGSTSTKIAVFKGSEKIFAEEIRYSSDEIGKYPTIIDQKDFRYRSILEAMEKNSLDPKKLDAVVGRGGMLKPLKGGTYLVGAEMLRDLNSFAFGVHASSLGGIIADEIARPLGIPAFIVDPVSVDEMEDVSRITGLPEMQNYSRWHALNLRAIARRAAHDLGGAFEDFNFIMVHLGGGVTVAALRGGRAIDVNNALDGGGPFSPERSGSLPTGQLLQACYSGKYTEKEMFKKLAGKGGMVAHLGTNDGREIEKRILAGDEKAELVLRALAFQIAKEIGGAAATLKGEVRAIAITGGLAHQQRLVNWIEEAVRWIAPVMVYPGEDELQALAEGGMRVLKKEEQPLDYATKEAVLA
ncbi:MAG TPA: butyrate kinase [Chroococcales cyanobacterium]